MLGRSATEKKCWLHKLTNSYLIRMYATLPSLSISGVNWPLNLDQMLSCPSTARWFQLSNSVCSWNLKCALFSWRDLGDLGKVEACVRE